MLNIEGDRFHPVASVKELAEIIINNEYVIAKDKDEANELFPKTISNFINKHRNVWLIFA